MLIKKLYLIQTTDKSPYVFEVDSDVFNAMTLPNTKNQTITSINLKNAVAVVCSYCARIEFNDGFTQGRELYIPYDEHRAHRNYNLQVILNYAAFTNIDIEEFKGKLASGNYQLIMTDVNNQSYICYAEMITQDFDSNYGDILIFSMSTDDVKEGLFKIGTLTTGSATITYEFCAAGVPT